MITPHYWSGEALRNELLAFENFLNKSCGIKLSDGSSIYTTVQHLSTLIDGLEGKGAPSIGGREEFVGGIGLADLVVKTCAVIDRPRLASFCGHFRLLLEPGGLVQNTKTVRNEDATNKLFELLVALSLLQVTPDVDLEDPLVSDGGSNPDVIADFGGSQWSFACKVMNTRNIKSYYDRVEDGLRQIQNARGQGRGFVVVNVKNLLNLDELWPSPPPDVRWEDGAWPSMEHLGAQAEAQITNAYQDFENAFGGHAHIAHLFGDTAPRAVPAVLNYVNVAAPCMVNGRPTFTNLRMLVPLELGVIDDEAAKVLTALDKAIATP